MVHRSRGRGDEAAAEHDEALRRSLFARVQALFFAGAGLSQAVWDRLDRLGRPDSRVRPDRLGRLGRQGRLG